MSIFVELGNGCMQWLGGTMRRPSGNFSVVERRLYIGILLPIQKVCHVAFKVRRQKHSLRLAY